MLKIKFQDLDELYFISLEIEVLTYLQYLTQFDDHEDETTQNIFGQSRNYAKSYLLEKQCEMVKKLKDLIERDDFVNPDEKAVDEPCPF
ncbi:MAG: hypothetical protein J6J13_01420 [Clostridia bacterium]|nr:hypothetical protein [Clostridia bacterium]MBP3705898.1 hypothetical protein [Clostridia bacterium]